MTSEKKGTKVYTRLQAVGGREVTVRKRRGVFTLYVDNQEQEQFGSQAEAMAAADRLADGPTLPRSPLP